MEGKCRLSGFIFTSCSGYCLAHIIRLETSRYAVYQYNFHAHKLSPISTTTLLHVTPYGPSITDVMPYYLVLEFETSCDIRNKKWSNSLASLELRPHKWEGPQVLEGYCYQGAFFSPHHFAELKEMYDNQLLAYEAACKKLPTTAKAHRQSGVPNDLPTLKTFLEAGKRNRKHKQNIQEVRLLLCLLFIWSCTWNSNQILPFCITV